MFTVNYGSGNTHAGHFCNRTPHPNPTMNNRPSAGRAGAYRERCSMPAGMQAAAARERRRPLARPGRAAKCMMELEGYMVYGGGAHLGPGASRHAPAW
jgi:hypothetical protein